MPSPISYLYKSLKCCNHSSPGQESKTCRANMRMRGLDWPQHCIGSLPLRIVIFINSEKIFVHDCLGKSHIWLLESRAELTSIDMVMRVLQWLYMHIVKKWHCIAFWYLLNSSHASWAGDPCHHSNYAMNGPLHKVEECCCNKYAKAILLFD